MALICVAIISKQNYPLFMRSLDQSDADLELQYLVHSSLDVIEEKVSTLSSKGPNDPRESYLGLLYPTEEYKIYGHATNTRAKLIAVTKNSSTTKDSEAAMKQLLRTLHTSYTEVMSNPFYTPGTKIQSRKFDKTVTDMFQQNKN